MQGWRQAIREEGGEMGHGGWVGGWTTGREEKYRDSSGDGVGGWQGVREAV